MTPNMKMNHLYVISPQETLEQKVGNFTQEEYSALQYLKGNQGNRVNCPDDLKGRPISGGPERSTQRLSNLIEILLKPLVPTLKTYINDD